jgi:hypothetical protein
MNFEEIVEAIKKSETSYKSLYYEVYSDDLSESVGEIEIAYEAPTGDGQEMSKVLNFNDHKIFIKISGYYSSHGDSDYDNTYEQVFPYQKTITIYCQNDEEAENFEY